MSLSLVDSFGHFSLRYEFISYSDSYDDYLMALGTPSWVLGLAKASSERITVSSGVEGDSLKWHFKTGEMYVRYIGNIQKKLILNYHHDLSIHNAHCLTVTVPKSD